MFKWGPNIGPTECIVAFSHMNGSHKHKEDPTIPSWMNSKQNLGILDISNLNFKYINFEESILFSEQDLALYKFKSN